MHVYSGGHVINTLHTVVVDMSSPNNAYSGGHVINTYGGGGHAITQ